MSTSKQFSRRTFLRGLGVGAALPWLETVGSLVAWGDTSIYGKAITRYPDPAVEVIDPRFAKYKIGNAVVERLWTGSRWAEGPVWFGDGGYLLWSDIPNNRILKWQEATGMVSVYRKPANYTMDIRAIGKVGLSVVNTAHDVSHAPNMTERLLSS